MGVEAVRRPSSSSSLQSAPEPDSSTLKVPKYKYKYFPLPKYLKER